MNSNSKASAKRTQVVYSEPLWKLVGTKTLVNKKGEPRQVNVYEKNRNAKPVRVIYHGNYAVRNKSI